MCRGELNPSRCSSVKAAAGPPRLPDCGLKLPLKLTTAFFTELVGDRQKLLTLWKHRTCLPFCDFSTQSNVYLVSQKSIMSSPRLLSKLQHKVWGGRVPLEVRLASPDCRNYDQSSPYIVRSDIPISLSLSIMFPQAEISTFRSC
jgi:hypothetical protein